MTTRVAAPRARKTFSRLKHVLDLPNLIDIQRESFDWFLSEGLRETIDDISPIEDYTGNLAVVFEDITFDQPVADPFDCDKGGVLAVGGPAARLSMSSSRPIASATLLRWYPSTPARIAIASPNVAR